jgi:superfamily II DNA or RNA helicase
MFELRGYQQKAIDDLRAGYLAGHRCQVLALATGAGKTAIASSMIQNASRKGNSSLFIVDRIELVGQAANHLEAFGLKVGILQGSNTNYTNGEESGLDVIVGSIQTIRSRGIPPRGFVIIDEVHVLHDAHIKLITSWDKVPFIGLSATPLNPVLAEYFTHLVRGPSVGELIDLGHLVKPVTYAPNLEELQRALEAVRWTAGDYNQASLSDAMRDKVIAGKIVPHWEEMAGDRPTIVFAVDIAHSQDICGRFIKAGHNAAHIDCHTPAEERRELINRFKAGNLQVLCSVGVLAVGFDAPIASCAILARPTASQSLFIQQAGRVLRPYQGKTDCLLLDHAGNTHQHGLVECFRVPPLGTVTAQDKREAAKKRQEADLIECTECKATIAADALVCPHCGIETPRESHCQEVDVSLELQDKAFHSGEVITGFTSEEHRQWFAGFLWIARDRGYKQGWAWYAYKGAFNKNPGSCFSKEIEPEVPCSRQWQWVKNYFKKRAREMDAA